MASGPEPPGSDESHILNQEIVLLPSEEACFAFPPSLGNEELKQCAQREYKLVTLPRSALWLHTLASENVRPGRELSDLLRQCPHFKDEEAEVLRAKFAQGHIGR